MAKKTTKKTGAKPVGDALRDAEKKTAEKRAELAVERSIAWLQLYAKLDEIQVDAEGYFRFGRRVSEAEIDAELKRHPTRYRHGRDDAEWGLQHRDRFELMAGLSTLWERLPAIGFDHVDEPGRGAIRDLLRACHERDYKPERRFSELVAHAMKVVKRVGEIDAGLARGHEKIPDPFAIDVLRQLSKKPGTAKEVAVALAERRDLADPRKVERAIERLKKLGCELRSIPGHGYVISPSDRARLERIDRGI
jgi:hypothetical protein